MSKAERDCSMEQGRGVESKSKRRVTRLSRIDREKLESGEFDSPSDALHQYDAPAVRPLPVKESEGADQPHLSARDREILDARPPHFGNL